MPTIVQFPKFTGVWGSRNGYKFYKSIMIPSRSGSVTYESPILYTIAGLTQSEKDVINTCMFHLWFMLTGSLTLGHKLNNTGGGQASTSLNLYTGGENIDRLTSVSVSPLSSSTTYTTTVGPYSHSIARDVAITPYASIDINGLWARIDTSWSLGGAVSFTLDSTLQLEIFGL